MNSDGCSLRRSLSCSFSFPELFGVCFHLNILAEWDPLANEGLAFPGL